MSKSLDFKAYNSFNLSHDKKLTCDMGQLIPCLCKEVVPGDIFRCRAHLFMRLIPQLAPFMHTVRAYIHYFFVPSRLLQKDFETFITKGFSGRDDIPWAYVKSPTGGFGKYSLADYFGLPIDVPNLEVSALPFRAYNMIVNEWYLNENLQTYLDWSDGNGLDTTTPLSVQYRCWMSDRFTAALPWAQRGDPVYLPLGVDAPVGINSPVSDVNNPVSVKNLSTGGNLFLHKQGDYDNIYPSTGGKSNFLVADLSTATSATVDAVRTAFQVQKWMVKNARGGVRYIEFLLSHFGEKSSDARLQRPEYLGGGKSVIVTSEVLQTSSTDSTSPQGNMSGHSFTGQQTMSFTRRFEEFGYVIGILSVMPETQYQQGVERMWSRKTPLDYYFPTFSHLRQQAILNKEVYAQGNSQDEEVFGFEDMYQELRRSISTVSGDFRDTLNYWTMTRIFENLPQLNADFVSAKDVTKRIFSVTNSHCCLVDIGFQIQALRKLPKHGAPGLIDHG